MKISNQFPAIKLKKTKHSVITSPHIISRNFLLSFLNNTLIVLPKIIIINEQQKQRWTLQNS